jgi:hypothetical protein
VSCAEGFEEMFTGWERDRIDQSAWSCLGDSAVHQDVPSRRDFQIDQRRATDVGVRVDHHRLRLRRVGHQTVLSEGLG